ncbi:MAG: DNA translocase FtsK [bacterium]|nr:DNA translocase FtsK [bacterium]
MAREAGKVRARSAAKMRGTSRAGKSLNNKKASDEQIVLDAASGEGEELSVRGGTDRHQNIPEAKLERFSRKTSSSQSHRYWGIVLLFIVVPFFLFCLGAPDTVGIIGVGVNSFLTSALGIAAWIVPLLGLYLALALLSTDAVLVYSLKISALLIPLGMVLTAGRMGRHAGSIGNYIDELLTGFIGPVGAWMLAVSAIALGLGKLWQITSEDILELMTVTGHLLEKLFWALGRFSVWFSKIFCKGVAGVAKRIRSAVDSFYSQGALYNEDSRARSRNRMADRHLRMQERAKQNTAYSPAEDGMAPPRPVGLVKFEDEDNGENNSSAQSSTNGEAALASGNQLQPAGSSAILNDENYEDCLFDWNDEDEACLLAGNEQNPAMPVQASLGPYSAAHQEAEALLSGRSQEAGRSATNYAQADNLSSVPSQQIPQPPAIASAVAAASPSAANKTYLSSADEIERVTELGARLRQSTKNKLSAGPDGSAASAALAITNGVYAEQMSADEKITGETAEKTPRPAVERPQPPVISDEEKALLRKRLLGSTIPRAKRLSSDSSSKETDRMPVPHAGMSSVLPQGNASKYHPTAEISPKAEVPSEAMPAANAPIAVSEPRLSEEEKNIQQQAEKQAALAEARANWLANQQRLRSSLQRQAQKKQAARNKCLADAHPVSNPPECGEQQFAGNAANLAETSLTSLKQEVVPQAAAETVPPTSNLTGLTGEISQTAGSERASSSDTSSAGARDFWSLRKRAAETSAASQSQTEKGKSTEIGQVVVRPASYNPLSNTEKIEAEAEKKAVTAPSNASSYSQQAAAQKAKALRNFWGGKGVQNRSNPSVKPVWAAVGVSSSASDDVPRQEIPKTADIMQPNGVSAPVKLPVSRSITAAESAVPSKGDKHAAQTENAIAKDSSAVAVERSSAVSNPAKKDKLRNFWGGKRPGASPGPKKENSIPVSSDSATLKEEAKLDQDLAWSERAASPVRTLGHGRNVWADLEAKKRANVQTAAASGAGAETADNNVNGSADKENELSKAIPERTAGLSAPSRKMRGHGRNVWAELEAKRQATPLAKPVGHSVKPVSQEIPLADRPTVAEDSDSLVGEKSVSDTVSAEASISAAPNSSNILPEHLKNTESIALPGEQGSAEKNGDFNEELAPLAITEEDYSDADDILPLPEHREAGDPKAAKGLGVPRLSSSLPKPAVKDRLGAPKLSLGIADFWGKKGNTPNQKPLLQKDEPSRANAPGSSLPSFLSVKRNETVKPNLALNFSAQYGAKSGKTGELPAVRRAQPLSIPKAVSTADKPVLGNLALDLQPTSKAETLELGKQETHLPLPVQETASAQENIKDKGQEAASAAETDISDKSAKIPKMLSIGGSNASAGAPVNYRLPSISLLDKPERDNVLVRDEDQSELLVDALASFKVSAKVVNVVHGPAVTRYELEPARGVTVKKFTNLRDDLALRLAAKTLRVEAPVPGKSVVGIEVPKKHVELVSLYDVIASDSYRKGKGLCFGLGKDIAGNVQVADLGKMPHLLIAGTTGSGKSVCINTIILSLIYRFTPSNLQMLMIDPKQVELSIYEGIPHLIGLADDSAKIVCDPKKAAIALNQMVELMEARYALFAKHKVRQLKEYNAHAEEKLPWVVVIIDELADLIMVAQKPVETAICRLAQKARAAGILMVVATQRPSADVLTGLIRSNIPSRISFAVPSQVESRIILDAMGAEDLLGKGDMLFKPLDVPAGIRIQGAFVTNEEIERVVSFWSQQAAPENRIEISVQEEPETSEEESSGDSSLDGDEEMIKTVLGDITNGLLKREKGLSASALQSAYRIGYSRARRIVELMEKRGYVGPANGAKAREILYSGGL